MPATSNLLGGWCVRVISRGKRPRGGSRCPFPNRDMQVFTKALARCRGWGMFRDFTGPRHPPGIFFINRYVPKTSFPLFYAVLRLKATFTKATASPHTLPPPEITKVIASSYMESWIMIGSSYEHLLVVSAVQLHQLKYCLHLPDMVHNNPALKSHPNRT